MGVSALSGVDASPWIKYISRYILKKVYPLHIRHFPHGETGEVRDYLWLKGWEPLLELKRRYDKVAYRIFFCVRGEELWLLSAYEKRSDAAPRRELEKAYRRMRLVLGGE